MQPTENDQKTRIESSSSISKLPAFQDAEALEELSEEDLNSLNRIRDILFGNQAKENDKRVRALEERLAKGLMEIRKETLSRIDALEQDLRRQFDNLSEQVRVVDDDRVRENQRQNRRIEEVRSELAGQLSTESRRLKEHLETAQQKTMVHIDRLVDALEESKADRDTLAQLFSYFASRLEKGGSQSP